MAAAFQPPPHLRALIDALTSLARERGVDAYVVGGTVRDVLLGRAVRDLDIAAASHATSFAHEAAERLDAHIVPLDDERGVTRLVLRGGGAGVRYLDVGAMQGALDADMRRRDFTIDALAVPVGGRAVIDVCGGLADLEAGVVRMNAPSVFDDDPLRLLRGARIASELGFSIEPQTEVEIRTRAPQVRRAAAERIRDELARIFALEASYGAVRLLDALGLLDVLVPELTAGRGVTQPEQFHAYDVYEHNVRTLEAMDLMLRTSPSDNDRGWIRDELWSIFGWCEPTLRAYLAEEVSEGRARAALLKLAALFHDVAKPATRTQDGDGRVRFFGHADAGAETVTKLLRRLRFSTREVAFVSTLVKEHLRPVQLAQVGEAPTRRAIYRFYRALGDAAPAVLLLALADAAAARGSKMTREGWSRQAAYMNSLLVRSIEDEGIVDPPRLLDGHDIMTVTGMGSGPAIGGLLEAVREAQAAGEIHSREEALAYVKARAQEGSSGQ